MDKQKKKQIDNIWRRTKVGEFIDCYIKMTNNVRLKLRGKYLMMDISAASASLLPLLVMRLRGLLTVFQSGTNT